VIPKWLSLGLIVVIFVASFLYARIQPPPPGESGDDAAIALIGEEAGRERQQKK
jgi:hypothetical protein